MTMTQPKPGPFEKTGGDVHALRLLLLASGGRLAAIVGCLTELGVADELVDGPLTSAELAERVGAEPAALDRLLRCGCAVGLFDSPDDDRFEITELSRGLLRADPASIRPLVLYSASELVTAPYRQLTGAVRGGGTAFEVAFGEPIWQHLTHDREHGAFFDSVMGQMSGRMIGTYVNRISDPAIGSIADVGGGTGSFLRAYLAANPTARGILVERPEVLAEATQAGIDRLDLCAADIFSDPLPAGCDAYLLMTVLHNWPADRARELLRSVRRAAGPASRLFVCEQVLAEGGNWDFGRLLDIDMMLLFGGLERTGRQWQQLLAQCGFEVVSGVPEAGWTVIECRPVEANSSPATLSNGAPAAGEELR